MSSEPRQIAIGLCGADRETLATLLSLFEDTEVVGMALASARDAVDSAGAKVAGWMGRDWKKADVAAATLRIENGTKNIRDSNDATELLRLRVWLHIWTFVWGEATDYLSGRVEPPLVRQYMSAPDFQNPTSIADVSLALISSLQNRQGMPNAIGKVSRLAGVLCDFDHLAILRRFDGGWEALFDLIQQNVKPTSRMIKSNGSNYWVVFCKGCLSAARYLRKFDTVSEFLRYVSDFDANANTRPALPLLLAHEVFGLGFAMACDFLKEIGFVNYCKPDTHITDIFRGLGLSDAAPLDIFHALATMAADVGETPYAVDKAFWLIGSGRLYNHDRTFDTDKFEFVRATLAKWEQMTPSQRYS